MFTDITLRLYFYLSCVYAGKKGKKKGKDKDGEESGEETPRLEEEATQMTSATETETHAEGDDEGEPAPLKTVSTRLWIVDNVHNITNNSKYI